MLVRIFLVLLSLVAPSSVYAQASLCGDPPPVANEDLKAEIEGKAQILSRLLGDASLSGEIQTSRTEIFSKYKDDEQSRSNAYLEYQFCVLIFNDQDMSTKEKIEELKNIRREFSKPTRVEGRLDGRWQGEAVIFNCSNKLILDFFVEKDKLFGNVQVKFTSFWSDDIITGSSGNIDGVISDGLISDIHFDVPLRLPVAGGASDFLRSFVLDGDFHSGRIKAVDHSDGCTNGTYKLSKIR